MAPSLSVALALQACLLAPAFQESGSELRFRPPAVPLVTSDPYLSVWSEADRLTDDDTRHWTHREHPLRCLVSVDGQVSRVMGISPAAVPALPQTALRVTPTRTAYTFRDERIELTLTFMTPLLPNDLDVFSRPVTYLTWNVRSVDGRAHRVRLYQGVGSELAVESPDQAVSWGREKFGALTALHVGTTAQTLLRPAGDDTRIDWGYAYAVAPTDEASAAIGAAAVLEGEFVGRGNLPPADDSHQATPVENGHPTLAFAFDLGEVAGTAKTRTMMVGYDEVYSIEYFGRKLRPYWRRNGATPAELFSAAFRDYHDLLARCDQFDRELVSDATAVGGAEYAQILALAYRECVAACGLAADSAGKPLFFTKENTSNGDIATVDVIFPMDPIWVLLSPTLAKASLVSNFDYAGSERWRFPNAPHDLGTYPLVFGRDDGGEAMAVEESGNMIILTDAIAHAEGNTRFAERYWRQLTTWTSYLEQYGLDPADQLCTDDFMGTLAHNANLSVKACLALAAYGDLCAMKGDAKAAERYRRMAQVDARHWMEIADGGECSLLAFDKPGTWSQKYNMVWDRILGLHVFPSDVAAREIAAYKARLQPYGLPLDSRTHLSKTDWSIWSATMARSRADFEAFIDPIYRYLNETTARDPIADSYMTDDPHSGGMHARPVVGGFFIKMLTDPGVWHKWASRDQAHIDSWAPIPRRPQVIEIVPTGRTHPTVWHYTTQRPAAGWMRTDFDDSSWASGPSSFGTGGTPGLVVGTEWKTDDIWIRRTVHLPAGDLSNLQLVVYHDEDIDVYIDGVPAFSESGYDNNYKPVEILPEARKLLKPGATLTVAAHCHQTTGGQGVDVGFAKVVER
jgi:hypothetical protein